MAGDFYTLKLIADIDDKKSDSEIQKYISEIQKKVSMDEKSKIKITVTPITDKIQDPNNAKKYIEVQKDLVTVQATYNNQLGQTIQETGKFKVAEDGATESVKKSNTYVSQAASAQRNLATEMGAVIRRTLESAATLGLMYGALNQLRQGVEYIKDLDKELTNVQVVTGMSQESVEKLGMEYNGLAKTLGATTLEVTRGSIEWLRQGKSAEETQELLRSSMMLSKLAAMDSADATEKLTAIMNGFKMEASESGTVISKLISLDNAYATSSKEIATAMQYSANSAQQAGVEYDRLASYITVISSTTRKSSESIGQSLKTIFSRMQNIKLGKMWEDEATTINDVEKVLSRHNIALRESETEFRDMDKVLDDVAAKWSGLGETEQQALAGALSGLHQRENFLVLMENYGEVIKADEKQLEDLSLGEKRYAEYLESVEAAQNRVTASWEKLWQKALSGGAVSSVYELTDGFLQIVDSIGGIPTVLGLATSAMIAFNWATIAAFASNPVTIWVVAIGTAITAIGALLNSIETVDEKVSRINQERADNQNEIKSLREKMKVVEELSKTYKELNYTKKQRSLDAEETQKLIDVQNKLKDLAPDLYGSYDKYGNFLISSIDDVNNLTDAIQKQIDALILLEEQQSSDLADIGVSEFVESSRAKEYADRGFEYSEDIYYGNAIARKLSDSEIKEINDSYAEDLNTFKNSFKNMTYEAKLDAIEQFKESGQTELAEMFKSFMKELEIPKDERDDIVSALLPEDNTSAYDAGGETAESFYSGFKERISGISDESNIIDDLVGKSMSKGLELSDIKSVPEEYLSALEVENGLIQLNIDKVKELQLARAEEALSSAKEKLENNEIAKQEVDVLQLYYDQLLQSSQNTFGQFGQTAWAYDELLWTISNDALTAGYSFVDMENNALTSAQSIFEYMSQGDAQFNSVIAQIAQQTGMSIVEVMNLVKGEISRTAAYASSVMGGLGAGFMGAPFVPPPPPSSGGSMFPTPTIRPPSYSGGSSGGSSKDDKETKKAERLREIEKEISDARNDATKALKNQLKIYKEMVDERKKLLDTIKEERDYQQDLEEKQNNVADIQNQIAELSLDDSAEAQAQVLALQEQLADAQQELGNLEFEHGIDQQQTALDDELLRVENLVENAIMAIEGIDAGSLASFTSQLSTILAGLGSAVPQFHDGGVVGGRYESKENEQFAKLLRKEVVVTPDQMSNFMNKTLPTIMSGTPSVSSSLQGMEIGQLMNFNIGGNLDRNVLPSIEKIANMVVDKLNDNMLIRGTKRGAGLFSA